MTGFKSECTDLCLAARNPWVEFEVPVGYFGPQTTPDHSQWNLPTGYLYGTIEPVGCSGFIDGEAAMTLWIAEKSRASLGCPWVMDR